LGNDLYEVRNSPFFAFDINFGDTVRVQTTVDDVPTVVDAVGRSGHKTLRIILRDQWVGGTASACLGGVEEMATNHEHAVGPLYSLDCRPEAQYPAVCDYLFELEGKGFCSTRRAQRPPRSSRICSLGSWIWGPLGTRDPGELPSACTPNTRARTPSLVVKPPCSGVANPRSSWRPRCRRGRSLPGPGRWAWPPPGPRPRWDGPPVRRSPDTARSSRR
jgi:Domain of unknown function (DUF4265)